MVAGEGRDGKVGSEMAENLVRSIPVPSVLREGVQIRLSPKRPGLRPAS